MDCFKTGWSRRCGCGASAPSKRPTPIWTGPSWRWSTNATVPSRGTPPTATTRGRRLRLWRWSCSWQEPRRVARDWTFRWRNRHFQIDARHAAPGLPGRWVVVVERRDGTLAMLYGERLLTFRDAPAPATPLPRPVAPQKPRPPRNPPPPDHPWQRFFLTHRRYSRPPPMGLGGPFLGNGKPASTQ